MKKEINYKGFEIGPIRPPSEAGSLLLRVTRNCPWNKCKFCGLYKGEKFSIRPVDHVVKDINLIREYVDVIENSRNKSNENSFQALEEFQGKLSDNEWMAFQSALTWLRGGMKSVFLQDANSLVMKPDDLVEILTHVHKTFPHVERVTSYARSSSIARISDMDMERIAGAGLNRIHIGMESGANEILEFVKKGVNKETHITAGQKVKGAGIELSEYFMPGLGGEEYSEENALETADAMNRINPDFIRIRTLALPPMIELYRDYRSGAFIKLNDLQMAEEILLFLRNLEGITSTVKSDHILNLFQEVEGRLPSDRVKITAPIIKFLAMAPYDQMLYMAGRRAGIFSKLEDLNDPDMKKRSMATCNTYHVTLDNVDNFTANIMKRFI